MASLDHTLWFHRPFRADEWWLYDQWSPSAHGGRGLAFGHVYTTDGTLVATAAQEGVIRARAAVAPTDPGTGQDRRPRPFGQFPTIHLTGRRGTNVDCGACTGRSTEPPPGADRPSP